MENVVYLLKFFIFLIEKTNEQISALLAPNSIEILKTATDLN